MQLKRITKNDGSQLVHSGKVTDRQLLLSPLRKFSSLYEMMCAQVTFTFQLLEYQEGTKREFKNTNAAYLSSASLMWCVCAFVCVCVCVCV